MNCYEHPGAASVATCVACRQPICEECREEVAGHPMCHPCVAAAAARLSQQDASARESAVELTAAGGPVGLSGAAPETPTEEIAGSPPGPGRRVLRGILWGFLQAQWWTVLMLFWGSVWGGFRFNSDMVVLGVALFFIFGFFGSLTGLIIGATNAPVSTGAAMGIGTGLLLFALEMLLTKNMGGLINIVFYFFTGRFIGAAIAGRVQQPIPLRTAGRGLSVEQ